jgi:hypothetical protein
VDATGRRLQVSADSGQSRAALAAKEMTATRASGYRSSTAATSSRATDIRDDPLAWSLTSMSGERSTIRNTLGASGAATRVLESPSGSRTGRVAAMASRSAASVTPLHRHSAPLVRAADVSRRRVAIRATRMIAATRAKSSGGSTG